MRASVVSALSFAVATVPFATAQTPTFTVVDTTSLNATLGNAGKGVLDPQVAGVTGVAFGNGTFVVVGASSGESVIRWATSPDGTTWTVRSQVIADGATSASQSKVHFLNDKFIFFAVHATGGSTQTFAYASTDGLTWTPHKVADGTHNFTEFDANPNRIMACGSNGEQYTAFVDLVTWTSIPVVTGGGSYSHNDVATSGARFVSTINGFGGQTYSSADGGRTWTALGGLAQPGGGYVESGNGTTLLSFNAEYYGGTDGVTFTKIAPTVPSLWILGGSPRFAGGRFLSLSVDLNTGKSGYLGSTDGRTWTAIGYAPPAPVPPTGTTRGYTYIDMAWGNGKYVLVAADTTQTLLTKTTVPAIFTLTADAAGSPNSGGNASSSQATVGGTITLAATGTGAVQWQRNGTAITGATSTSLAVSNFQPTDAGIYTAAVTTAGVASTQSFAVGITTTSKVVGSGSEIASNIVHPNGNVFDQILLEGAAAAFTADASLNQVTRLSFVDLTNDIVQLEFSGAGTVSIVLDNSSGPAAPINYNQTTNYMKGHAGIVVTGANETTNLSVFSVGKANAVNQALFKDTVTYDGFADIAFIAITSPNGKFGSLRTANTSYFATKGLTGVYAPNIQFAGPVFVGDINASDNATPVLIVGSSSDTRITGGDLLQTNGRAVQVAGLTQLKFTANANSHGVPQAAQTNRGRLEQNGVDVTAQIVVNP